MAWPGTFYFVGISAENAYALHAAAKKASYGWGCVPVVATIETTEYRTSLFPKDGGHLLPLKAAVRRILKAVPGDEVEAVLRVVPPRHTDHHR